MDELKVEGFYKFQSTLPVWGGTGNGLSVCSWSLFQSTLPVWGGTLCGSEEPQSRVNFNPPSPCGEGQDNINDQLRQLKFQSTLPVWGGTPGL